jgi:hypothetical protein
MEAIRIFQIFTFVVIVACIAALVMLVRYPGRYDIYMSTSHAANVDNLTNTSLKEITIRYVNDSVLLNCTPNMSQRVSKLLALNEFRFYNADCLYATYVNGHQVYCVSGDYNGPWIDIAVTPGMEQALVHEVGHQFWHDILNDSEKIAWYSIYNKTGGSTEYGDTEAGEDFADYFAWVENVEPVGMYHWIREEVKNKTALISKALDRAPAFDIRNNITIPPRRQQELNITAGNMTFTFNFG